MPVKVYHYPNCSTCRKALKWLEARGVEHTAVDIAATPPSRRELKQMLSHYDGDLRRLFNTSGQSYRKQNIRDRLPGLTPAQAVELLSRDGMLVKRPFVVTAKAGLVGFKEEEWAAAFG